MTTIKIQIIPADKVMNICGHNVIVENVHTKDLKFSPIGITLKELSKKLTGVDFCDNYGIFNHLMGTMAYLGHTRQMPKKIENVTFPSLCRFSTLEELESELKDRIYGVEVLKQRIDWLEKKEEFSILGKNVRVQRCTVNGNPVRIFADGKKYYGAEDFFEELANEYLSNLLNGAKLYVRERGITISSNGWDLNKLIPFLDLESVEVGEFEFNIINRLNTIGNVISSTENKFLYNNKLASENEMLKKQQAGNDRKVSELQKANKELISENAKQADLCIEYRATIKNLNDKLAKINKIIC